MKELDRARELMEAERRRERVLRLGRCGLAGKPDAADLLLLSERVQILADLIAAYEKQRAELRTFRDDHMPISQPVYSQPYVVVKDCDASVSDGDTGDDDD